MTSRTVGTPLPVSSPHLTAHAFLPASRQTVALEQMLRRTWVPVARNWRMTPRGVRMLQRATEPGRRVPALKGSVVEHLRVAGLPAEWVRGPRALGATAHRDDRAVVLYLHGGGYVFGSPRTHRNLVSRISHVTGLPALSLDYRLPPVATLPAPIEDALAAYRHLLDEGHAPERIVVAGDSAGGHLALTLALHAVDAGLPAPAALVLLSPWTDLGMTGASMTRNAARDPFLPPIALRRAARVALAGADPADWRSSPLFAPEALLRALPPTLLQVGSTEVLYDDATRTAQRIADAGVRTELQVYERQPHVVPLWSGTPEARTALREIGRFVASALDVRDAPAPPSEQTAATAASS
ncbi:MAG TPA: alpha/beta hydrolase [Conexibacter sp.]|jgi:monoterpene epsilon-lactone hydrolase|nr:alpha/beta hydrolase [Conexibacter sp.]